MGDLGSYRVVRAPTIAPADHDAVYRPLPVPPPGEVAGGMTEKQALKYVSDPHRYIDPAFASPDLGEIQPLAEGLQLLDTWLTAQANHPGATELTEQMQRLLAAAGLPGDVRLLIDAAMWRSYKGLLCDSLVAALTLGGGLRGSDPVRAVRYAEAAMRLSRRLLVVGLVEFFASAAGGIASDDTYRLLHDRTVLLPSDPEGRRPRDTLVRRPGFADLYVVRSEWCCYLAGEVAHVENVMSREFKERTHVRLDETETTQTLESESKSSEERETQTTDRFTLDAQTARETQLKLNINASIDTSGQYGPTRINAHVGGSFDYSQDESRRIATTEAHEAVARAVSKVEQSVRETRTTRTLNRITETNVHRVDATASDQHITGVYRWVDKVETVQLFRYPHRYLLEFQLPEPAALYVWAQERAKADSAKPPPAFTTTGESDGPALTAAGITPATYQMYAARYGAVQIPPPPAPEKVVQGSVALEAEPPNYTEKGEGNIDLRSAPQVAKTWDLAIPDGYAAISVAATGAAAPALARWGDTEMPGAPPLSDNHYHFRWGYHYPRVDVTIGDLHLALEDRSRPTVASDPPLSFKDGWMPLGSAIRGELRPAPTGKVTVAAAAAGTFRSTVSVSLTCRATDTLKQGWAADAFDKILAAWKSSTQAHADATTDLFGSSAASLGDADPPEFNAKVVHEELKRQIVELLVGEPFAGYSMVVPGDASQPPHLDPVELEAAAPYIQFMEQALEWENITYVFYPYFWAKQDQWTRLAARRSSDADFAQFLRAGSARVVVPARPHFENAVNAFLDYGVLWSGGPAPAPDDPLYVSIADEIRQMQQGSPDGEPGDSWQVRLPTTLVWLQPGEGDEVLSRNRHPRLDPPANDQICPGREP